MRKKSEEAKLQLSRLSDALALDVDNLTDEELFEEFENMDCDPKTVMSDIQALIGRAVTDYRKQRLASARAGFDAHKSRCRSTIVQLPVDVKKALVDRFAANNDQLQEKLTIAARNEDDIQADIDSFLEDLVELGVIDDEGNIK